jgi:hypothetical protein
MVCHRRGRFLVALAVTAHDLSVIALVHEPDTLASFPATLPLGTHNLGSCSTSNCGKRNGSTNE